jgi:hypothetical protein
LIESRGRWSEQSREGDLETTNVRAEPNNPIGLVAGHIAIL